MTWILFWKLVFVVVLALFAVVATLVTFFGARDIRRLLRRLKERKEIK